jgi:hypothetical protein
MPEIAAITESQLHHHLGHDLTCGNCGHRRTIDEASPKLRN